MLKLLTLSALVATAAAGMPTSRVAMVKKPFTFWERIAAIVRLFPASGSLPGTRTRPYPFHWLARQSCAHTPQSAEVQHALVLPPHKHRICLHPSMRLYIIPHSIPHHGRRNPNTPSHISDHSYNRRGHYPPLLSLAEPVHRRQVPPGCVPRAGRPGQHRCQRLHERPVLRHRRRRHPHPGAFFRGAQGARGVFVFDGRVPGALGKTGGGGGCDGA